MARSPEQVQDSAPGQAGHPAKRGLGQHGHECCGRMGWLLALEPWSPGALEPWSPGAQEPWRPETLEPWNPGPLETWNPGTLEPWNRRRVRGQRPWPRFVKLWPGALSTSGACTPRRALSQYGRGMLCCCCWNPGTFGPWNPGTLEPWNPGILEPWNPDPWDPGTADWYEDSAPGFGLSTCGRVRCPRAGRAVPGRQALSQYGYGLCC